MAATELREFLKYGNIRNSVNYPNCEMPYTPGKARVSIMNKNIPNMIGSIAAVFAKEQLNIDNMINKSKNDYAYTMLDLEVGVAAQELADAIKAIDGVIRVRVID